MRGSIVQTALGFSPNFVRSILAEVKTAWRHQRQSDEWRHQPLGSCSAEVRRRKSYGENRKSGLEGLRGRETFNNTTTKRLANYDKHTIFTPCRIIRSEWLTIASRTFSETSFIYEIPFHLIWFNISTITLWQYNKYRITRSQVGRPKNFELRDISS